MVVFSMFRDESQKLGLDLDDDSVFDRTGILVGRFITTELL